ncbi:MAG: helicase HerA-like domain-containing protein, partial [Paracoccus sp. (in: a-proteobacteria)]
MTMCPVLDFEAGTVFVGGAGADHAVPELLLLRQANRHGLIAGATGTGKTVTLQTLAESLSMAGVPVFMSDVKGDLAGMAVAGSAQGKLHGAFRDRAQKIGLDLEYRAFPVAFWDVWAENGYPVRATVSE